MVYENSIYRNPVKSNMLKIILIGYANENICKELSKRTNILKVFNIRTTIIRLLKSIESLGALDQEIKKGNA